MSLPSVSCILPCGYGDKYVGTALDCFAEQTYAGPLELVFVDNNEVPFIDEKDFAESSAFHGAARSLKYLQSKRMSVGALRNLGTKHATGEICVTWDEDDWSAPDRVAQQVKRLLDSGKAVTGWHNILYFNEQDGQAYKYLFEPSGRNHPPYAMGTSQCYRKSWWEKHKFNEGPGVEDWPFSQEAMHAKQLDSCDAEQLCVARIHNSNIVTKVQVGTHKQWPKVERTALPQEFFAAMARSSNNPPMAEQGATL